MSNPMNPEQLAAMQEAEAAAIQQQALEQAEIARLAQEQAQAQAQAAAIEQEVQRRLQAHLQSAPVPRTPTEVR